MKITELRKHLETHHIKPSHQRLKIYQYLVENRNHPNVDMIYRELSVEIPTLSKTTVYNTLNLFVERGLVSLITITENEMRYDADTSLHGHFRCDHCGTIYDLRLRHNSLEFDNIEDFRIDESHLYFKGLCAN
jgi:Fur family peroxide stress response transcriptional regulator